MACDISACPDRWHDPAFVRRYRSRQRPHLQGRISSIEEDSIHRPHLPVRGAGQEEDRGPAVEEMQAPHHRRGGWPAIKLNVWTIGINSLSQVSMVDGNYFKKLEAVAKAVRGNDRPFGGIQLIMTGRWRSH